MNGPDRYAVLGNPVAHSQSPFIHAAFARQTGQVLDYDRQLCALDGFTACVRQFVAEGGRGCNVTVPFKFEAVRLAAQVTRRAALAEAANVLRFDDVGGWWADNSDGIGLMRDIENNAHQPLAGQRVLVIGAGGAAAGVLGPLLDCRPARVRVLNRTPSRARGLVERHADLAQQHNVTLESGGLDVAAEEFDVVINATASSLQGAKVPVSDRVLAPGALAVDLMYGVAAAPFLAWAEAAGARARDGLGMLVEQAAEAFFAWRGVRPSTAPVLRALREHITAQRP
jgi:shikimate dehydrogenase